MQSADGSATYMYLYRRFYDNQGTYSYKISKYDWYVETGVIYEAVIFDIGEEVLDMVAFPT